MVMQGETIQTGASSECPNCGREMPLQVCHSNAGYYIGTMCCLDVDTFEELGHCQPYSRESGYYKSKEEAQAALNGDNFFRG